MPVAMKVIVSYVGTVEIAENPRIHYIYYDGENHYYIYGMVLDSGVIPVLMMDTDKYYRVTETGNWLYYRMMKKINEFPKQCKKVETNIKCFSESIFLIKSCSTGEMVFSKLFLYLVYSA